MRVYKVGMQEDLARIDVGLDLEKHFFDYEQMGLGYARRVVQPWAAPNALPMKLPRMKRRVFKDITAIGAQLSAPALSTRAKAVFAPVLGEYAQWLPITVEDHQYWLLNVLCVVDLDDALAVTEKYGGPPGISSVRQYAFKLEDVSEKWLLKARTSVTGVLCSRPCNSPRTRMNPSDLG
jgi:hypothetical protein